MRKPILLEKLTGNSDYEEKKTIGLIGISRGAGVTHTGMLLSTYFGIEKRIKTACLECNNHQDFGRLQDFFEWTKEDDKSFALDRVTFYKQVSRSDIPEIFSDDYGCYILDFGTDFISWKEEFLRCGTKIIIGNHAIWNQSKIESFLASLDNIKGSKNWLYMIPYADKSFLKVLSKRTDRDFIRVPYELDPLIISKDTYKMFKCLFG